MASFSLHGGEIGFLKTYLDGPLATGQEGTLGLDTTWGQYSPWHSCHPRCVLPTPSRAQEVHSTHTCMCIKQSVSYGYSLPMAGRKGTLNLSQRTEMQEADFSYILTFMLLLGMEQRGLRVCAHMCACTHSCVRTHTDSGRGLFPHEGIRAKTGQTRLCDFFLQTQTQINWDRNGIRAGVGHLLLQN